MTTNNDKDTPAAPVENTSIGILSWFEKAVPKPEKSNLQSQLGCHLEEVIEMLECISVDNSDKKRSENFQALSTTIRNLKVVSNGFKNGNISVDWDLLKNDTKFLDAIIDQQVTGIGMAYMMGMDPIGAASEVNKSNWSKFDENGNPIFNENKKITKGPNYKVPNLTNFVGKKFD